MIKFYGTYFDGKTSKANQVSVIFINNSLYINDEGSSPITQILISNCTIIPPLGKTRRSIRLPEGAILETYNFEAVKELECRLGSNPGIRLVDFLEQRWRLVTFCVIGLIICTWAFINFGIPALSEKAAYSISPVIMEKISLETVKLLDIRFLEKSELSPERAEELRALFMILPKEPDTALFYRLEFRKAPVIGPNAFALPSGLIIMTDEVVNISEDNTELIGIMMHEVAHVKNRHGIRSIMQNTGIFFLISALVGDVTSITSMAATLPTLLAQTGYSRDFEREADNESGLYLIKQGWSTRPYQEILLRITKKMPEYPGGSMISTHPETSERVSNLQILEKLMADKD